MPLKKVIADFGRGVFSPLGGKNKGNQKNNSFSYYQNCNRHSTLPSRHIYYEPPEDFDWDATSSLLPDLNTAAGEVIVHRTPVSPESKSDSIDTSRKDSGLPQSDTNISSDNSKDSSKGKERAYTEEEFTSAILARTQRNPDSKRSSVIADDDQEVKVEQDMSDSGVASMVRDSLVSNGQTAGTVDGHHEECDCERRCSNPKHGHECKSGDYGVSPILERRNKSVLGRLRNFASRSSYSTSEDGHSHSSDYEDPDDEKKNEFRFAREARERSSSSWAGRVRDLHRDVKKKISRFRNSRGTAPDDDIGEGNEGSDVVIEAGSSVESIPSGSGSSLQPPTPTSSNRSSTSAGEEDVHGGGTFVGTFIGKARALVDCTPSPYDRDGLAFKKGDVIDIIAKHKTGIWVGMAQGKIGHFKFINVQEIVDERKKKHRRRKASGELNLPKKPESLEELLDLLGLQEYTNVLVLNGYDELDTFKDIEKVDLDNLGITDSDHSSKLLRASEMLQDADLDEEEVEDEESCVKQSPRDSGCYASHENLNQRDSSQKTMSNGQFAVDLEDQDTSHSESGIHSRDGQESTVMMNNLDVSVDSSSRSTSNTVEDGNGTVDMNEPTKDISNYNILPTQEDTVISQEQEDISALTSAIETVVAPSHDLDSTTVSIPYLLAGNGPKSSPGSPRKTRSKHSRNKSHSHRSKDLYNDLTFHSFGYAKYRHISSDSPPDQGTYVYSWGSFTKKEKNTRRNFHEYDDVVSDPATEAEDSPGLHVYRRVKQRKGSLQTLIHDTRPPSPTLMSKVNKKLVAEKIYLHEEPYTDKTGFCGIPPALVQRYSEELQRSVMDVADALDQIRITSLQQQARRGVPNDFLSDSCIVPVLEPNYMSLRSWLISLGVPMYESNFTSAGLHELHHISTLSIEDLAHVGIHDSYHQTFLESALTVLYLRFRRRPQTYAQGQSLS